MADVPITLKSLAPYLRLAKQFEARDLVVSYYFLMYFVQNGIKLGGKDDETKIYLLGIMDKMDGLKSQLVATGDEAVSNDIVASSHIESKALQLFNFADREDRNSNFDVKIVKTFYTASLLFELLTLFGELNEESAHHKKYAQWKATYLDKCRKTGEAPVPGPSLHDQENEFSDDTQPSSAFQPPALPYQTYQPPAQAYQPPAEPYQPPPQQYQPPQPTQPYQPQLSHPYTPSVSHTLPASDTSTPQVTGNANISAGELLNFDTTQHQNLDYHQIERVQKLCRFASSALNYQDFPACLDNLQKAINVIRCGRES